MTEATRVRHPQPYPGMRPFEANEADLLFGQDTSIAALVKRLGDCRLIAVLGDSGCGKSSLIKAGLLPKLLGSRTAAADRLWRTALARPGNSPIANLAEELSAPTALGLPRSEIEPMLQADSFGLAGAIAAAKLAPGRRVLIVIDQFEELFRFANDPSEDARPGRDEAALFVKLLLNATSAQNVAGATPVYVVLTMRSEYLGDCASFFGLAEAINDGAYLVPKMTRTQLEATISGPVEIFDADIEYSLVQRLMNEAEAAQQDGLPLLQHALRRIWTIAAKRGAPVHIRMTDFESVDKKASGDLLIEKHLNQELDMAQGELPQEQQRNLKRMFQQLGEFDSKGRLTRRSCDLPTIAAVCGIGLQEALSIANAFREEERGRSFLMPPRSRDAALLSGQEKLDISHEALLRRWAKLRAWTTEEARHAEQFRALADRVNRKSAVMSGAELRITATWWKQFQPGLTWSRRYEGAWDPRLRRYQYDFQSAQAYLERSVRFVWLRIGFAILVGVFLLVIIPAGLYLRASARDSAKENERLRSENASLLTQTQELNKLQAQILEQNGWTADLISEKKGSTHLAESVQANDLLRTFPATGGPVTVEYWSEPGDTKELMNALLSYWKQCKYQYVVTPQSSGEANNAVWFHGPIGTDDLKRITLSLIRAGLRIRKVGPLAEPGPDRVLVGYDAQLNNLPIWSVAEIKATHDFNTPRMGTDQAYLAIDNPSDTQLQKVSAYLNGQGIFYKATVSGSGASKKISNIATGLMTKADTEKLQQHMITQVGIAGQLRQPY